MQSKYFAHQTPQSKTIFDVFEILRLFLIQSGAAIRRMQKRITQLEYI